MTEQSTEFEGIIEHITDPLLTKKASFVGCVTAMLFVTWLLLLPAIAWMVYGAAF